MSEHILITGGAGFIGSHVADELLRAGHRVRILDNLTREVHGPSPARPAYLSPDVELLVGDVRDKEALGAALLFTSTNKVYGALTDLPVRRVGRRPSVAFAPSRPGDQRYYELRVPMQTLAAIKGISDLTVAVGPHASTTPRAALSRPLPLSALEGALDIGVS